LLLSAGENEKRQIRRRHGGGGVAWKRRRRHRVLLLSAAIESGVAGGERRDLPGVRIFATSGGIAYALQQQQKRRVQLHMHGCNQAGEGWPGEIMRGVK